MENKTRFVGMLGFAMRAGKVLIGCDLVCRALPKSGEGRVELVMVCAEASDSTKKKITTKCAFYNTDLIEIPLTLEELGHLLGKTYGPAVVAIRDSGFARELKAAYGDR